MPMPSAARLSLHSHPKVLKCEVIPWIGFSGFTLPLSWNYDHKGLVLRSKGRRA